MTFTAFTANCQIIRADHQTGYNKFQNNFFRNHELSRTARLVHGYFLSNSDNWHVTLKYAARDLGMCQTTLTKYICELMDKGRIVRERIRSENGWFGGYQYTVFEQPPEKSIDPPPEPPQSRRKNSVTEKLDNQNLRVILKTKSTNNQSNELNLSPTPQIWEEDEIDFWSVSDPEPDACQGVGFGSAEIVDSEPVKINLGYASPTADLSTAPVSSEGESSAADYNQTTVVATKVTRRKRQAAQRKATWLEFGRENGLWQSIEELHGFMKALYDHAVNNPRLHTPGKWAESEVRKTCEQGTSTHWIEYQAALAVGSIDRKPWADIYGNVNPSFRSYIEQSKFGESGNSTARAVELAAQVLANPFKTELLWNEYQRRLERELEEMVKCERLGVTYDAPNVLKPKSQVSAVQTARTQQILGIDAAPQIYQPAFVESAPVPALEAAEDESDWGEAPWDKVAADVMAKMAALGEKVGISKPKPVPEVTPLSEIYAESKPVNQTEAQEFKVWFDSVKAEGLVDYSYGDSKHHAIVVLADGVTAMGWRKAQEYLADEIENL
jgi:hypothetical protein